MSGIPAGTGPAGDAPDITLAGMDGETPMRNFDHDFVEDVVRRLRTIPADAKPRWGTMSRDQLFGHLIMVMRYCMGRGPELPDKSTWVSRNLIRPLILNGLVPIPKNVRLPRPKSAPAPAEPAGDLETLHAVLEEYLSAVETGQLHPPPHFFFGDLGVDGWAKMHVHHFEHHLKQFGA